MVFFFTTSTGHVIYMGADKHENEGLIKHGLPTDVWFHVDDLSSAHVYLRLKEEETLDTVSPTAIHECATLVKANSIEGCKKGEVTILYTPWANLHKTSDMVAGAIGHHDRKQMFRTKAKKDGPLVNKLNKTKKEEFPDLLALQQDYARQQQVKLKEAKRLAREAAAAERAEREKQKELESYSSLFDGANMLSNAQIGGSATAEAAKDFEDDFM